MEDITLNNPTQVGLHSKRINTVLYDDHSSTLFAGGEDGKVVQYKKSEQSNVFTLVKDYKNVGLGYVFSSTKIGDFVAFGGSKGSVALIDISGRTKCKGSIKTGFGSIRSLTGCGFSTSKKALLSISGRNPEFSGECTDIYEVQGKGLTKANRK